MRRPHKTTIATLTKRKQGTTWRALARVLGLNYGVLNDIGRNKEGAVSIEGENQVRAALGLRRLTYSGEHVYRPRQLVRPVLSQEQNLRRLELEVSWWEVVEAGLETLGVDGLKGEENGC